MTDHGRNLAAGRIVIGAATFAAPSLASKALGLGGDPKQALPLRLFAIRDLALGVVTLGGAPERRKRALQQGILCDLGDAVAAVQGVREGSLPVPAAVLTGVAAVSAIVAGVLALGQAKPAAVAAAVAPPE